MSWEWDYATNRDNRWILYNGNLIEALLENRGGSWTYRKSIRHQDFDDHEQVIWRPLEHVTNLEEAQAVVAALMRLDQTPTN